MITKKRYQRNEGTGNAVRLLDLLPEKDRDRLEFLINRGRNPDALTDLTRALSVVEADPELSAKATGERWNLRVYWDKSPIGRIPLMEIYPNENYGHRDWQSCFSNADYFVTLGAPDRLGYDFYDHVADIRELTGRVLSSQKDKAARKINQLVADLKKGTGKDGGSTWKIHSPVTNLHFEEGIMKNEKAKTVGEDKSRESKGRRNERGDSYDNYTANVILQTLKGSGAAGLEYQDDDTYIIRIGIDELTKALRNAGVPEELLDGENVMSDIDDALSYYDDIGQANVETWYSPSQSFEDPGDGGSRATLDLNDKDRWDAVYGAVRAALQVYALGVLEIFGASNGNFIERGDYKEADIPGIMKEVEASPELQDSLKEMNLANADVETLLKAAIDPRTAVDPGNLIIDLDGDVDDNW